MKTKPATIDPYEHEFEVDTASLMTRQSDEALKPVDADPDPDAIAEPGQEPCDAEQTVSERTITDFSILRRLIESERAADVAAEAGAESQPDEETMVFPHRKDDEPAPLDAFEAHADPFAGLSITPLTDVTEATDVHLDGLRQAELESPVSGADAAGQGVGFEPLATGGSVLGEPVAPRITIHAFCATDPTIEAVRKAAGDRRMERASVIVRSGGLTAAVDHYQNEPTPALVILEASEPPRELLSLLGRLAEVCDSGTKVVVIGMANDIALYRELMRQGVSDYLVPPLTPLQLIGSVTSLYADPATPFIGRQVAFCGAKGGVGASTIAHNVAFEISERMSAATVIVDLDLAFGTAALDFNHDPLQGMADALSQPDRLDEVLMDRMMAKHTDHLSLFAAPANLDQDYEIGSEVFEEVIHKIRLAQPYVVLDLPHAWSRWKRRLLLTSDDLVIVAEPDLACLRNAKNILDLVRAARPNDPQPRIVLNKVGVPGRPEIPLKDFGEALGIVPSLSIPFDAKAFGTAANNGQMISSAASKSKAGESLEQLVRLLLNQRGAPAAAPSKASMFTSFFKRK